MTTPTYLNNLTSTLEFSFYSEYTKNKTKQIETSTLVFNTTKFQNASGFVDTGNGTLTKNGDHNNTTIKSHYLITNIYTSTTIYSRNTSINTAHIISVSVLIFIITLFALILSGVLHFLSQKKKKNMFARLKATDSKIIKNNESIYSITTLQNY